MKRSWRRASFDVRMRFTPPAKLAGSVPAGPIVVGAIGGSGTRAIVQLLTESGVFMGQAIDRRTLDSLPLRWFLSRHFHAVHENPWSPPRAAVQDFHRALTAHGHPPHRTSSANIQWGFKNPRWMWLLPFLAGRFEGLRFVHVVRDGRDMALSRNRNLHDENGRRLLGARWSGDPLRDQLALWSEGNRFAAAVAAESLPTRSLRIRFEDLCARPARELERLLEFTERAIPAQELERIAASVEAPVSLGRGRRSPSLAEERLDPIVRETLDRFGYAQSDGQDRPSSDPRRPADSEGRTHV